MKELYAELDRIVSLARRGFITLYEANTQMLKVIDNYDGSGKLKAYHRMYKLLFEVTKEN